MFVFMSRALVATCLPDLPTMLSHSSKWRPQSRLLQLVRYEHSHEIQILERFLRKSETVSMHITRVSTIRKYFQSTKS